MCLNFRRNRTAKKQFDEMCSFLSGRTLAERTLDGRCERWAYLIYMLSLRSVRKNDFTILILTDMLESIHSDKKIYRDTIESLRPHHQTGIFQLYCPDTFDLHTQKYSMSVECDMLYFRDLLFKDPSDKLYYTDL